MENLDERIRNQQQEIQKELSCLTRLQRELGLSTLPSLQQKVLQADLQKLQAIQAKLKARPGDKEFQIQLIGQQMILVEHLYEIQESLSYKGMESQLENLSGQKQMTHSVSSNSLRHGGNSSSHLPLSQIPQPPNPLSQIPQPPNPLSQIPQPPNPLSQIPQPSLELNQQAQLNQMLRQQLLAEQLRQQQLTNDLIAEQQRQQMYAAERRRQQQQQQQQQQQMYAMSGGYGAGYGAGYGTGYGAYYNPLQPSIPLI